MTINHISNHIYRNTSLSKGTLLAVVLCLCFFVGSVVASGKKTGDRTFAADISQNKVAWFTVNAGGTTQQTSTNYQAGLTIGQPVSGTSTSTNYKTSLGFWYKDLGLPTGVEEIEHDQLPGSFSLSQNYPNPFNPSTTIDFTVPKKGNVRIVVYNLLGQQVVTLVDQPMAAGVYRTVWEGCNEAGHAVASGIYFYRMEADNFVSTKKMVLLK